LQADKVRAETKQTEMRLVVSAEEIARQVRRLARKISADYEGSDLIVLGVLKGAFIFLADLVRHLTIPVEVDFVRLASYGDSTVSKGELRIKTDLELDVRKRDVLIVEDIVDSGRTLEFLRKRILKQEPGSLRICALLDKKERRVINVPIDYVALQLDKGFVVGYGLDCNEVGRHYPDIYELVL
jgi:hypoxanthine phosphoribosyltransferase